MKMSCLIRRLLFKSSSFKPSFFKTAFSALLIPPLAFACCAHADLSDMSRIYRQTPQLQAFEICFGGGCAEVRKLDLTPAEWQKVVHLFMLNKSTDASQ